MQLIESKSGETLHQEHYKNLNKLSEKLLAKQPEMIIEKHLVYGGVPNSVRFGVETIGWNSI